MPQSLDLHKWIEYNGQKWIKSKANVFIFHSKSVPATYVRMYKRKDPHRVVATSKQWVLTIVLVAINVCGAWEEGPKGGQPFNCTGHQVELTPHQGLCWSGDDALARTSVDVDCPRQALSKWSTDSHVYRHGKAWLCHQLSATTHTTLLHVCLLHKLHRTSAVGCKVNVTKLQTTVAYRWTQLWEAEGRCY